MTVSVISGDLSCRPSQRFTFRFRGATPIDGAIFRNVLYLPDCGLQIVGQRYVPREAVFDDYALKLMQQRHGGKPSGQANLDEAEFIGGTTCILTNCFSRNFAHWTEELFKVIVLEDYGFDGSYLVPDSPGYCREFMRLLGIEEGRMLSDITRPAMFEHAIYTTMIGHEDVLSYPEVVFAFRDTLFDACPSDFRVADRLWLDRDHLVRNKHRELVNKDEIYQLLRHYDIQVVDMAQYPLQQQVAASRSAKLLSGPHGAGFIHGIFMSPGATVIECFSPLHLKPSCLEIFSVLEHRYFQVVPVNTAYEPYPYGNRLKLNIRHLRLVLESALKTLD